MKPSTSDIEDKESVAKEYLSGWSRIMRRVLEATFLFLNFAIAMVQSASFFLSVFDVK